MYVEVTRKSVHLSYPTKAKAGIRSSFLGHGFEIVVPSLNLLHLSSMTNKEITEIR